MKFKIEFQTLGKREHQEDFYVSCKVKDRCCVAVYDGHSLVNKNDLLSSVLAQKTPECFSIFFKNRPINKKNILEFIDKIDSITRDFTSGSCAAFFFAERENVFLAIVGDAEAAAIYKKRITTFTLHDFRDKKEVERFNKCGYIIENLRFRGLNISRTFGDKEIRIGNNHPLSPVPRIEHFKIDSPIHVFLFTDGMRELITNSNLVEMYRSNFEVSSLEKHRFDDNATFLYFDYNHE